MSTKTEISELSESERELPTEVGALGSTTLAFDPGFSLDTPYNGEPPAFAEGSKFGVYVVGPCIGEGGMARVYRAEHAGLKRQVALKVMTQSFARDIEGRERFLREARIAAAIKHPNVVNIFDVGVCQGIPYLVMELLEGEDLEKVIVSKGALDEGTIIDLVVPVVAGLVAVHDAGIVHRDLKPGNIFLAKGRNDEIEPKLLDFGISKASGKDHLRLTAASGSLMGTPFYMAPEAVQGAEMTPLSDQYALGVVLRECATGKNPFEGNNFAEVVGLISGARYTPLAEANPRLSKRFVAIVERAMSLDPKDRFEDMRAMGRQLLLLAGQRTRITWGLTFGPEGRNPLAMSSAIALEQKLPELPLADLEEAPPRKRRTALMLAGVALLSAGVTSMFLLSNGAPTDAAQAVNQTEILSNRGAEANVPSEPAPASPPENAPASLSATSDSSGEAPIATASEAAKKQEASEAEDNDTEKDADAAEKRRRRPVKKASRPSRTERRARSTKRRRTPARPAEDDTPEWEIRLSSKVAIPEPPSFEVGSNNAPILD